MAEARRGRSGASSKADRPLTKAELDRALFEYTTSLHGLTSQFGSNFASDGGPGLGAIHTETWAQTNLLREQNDILRRLTAGAGFSGTAFARAGLAAAGIGSGF